MKTIQNLYYEKIFDLFSQSQFKITEHAKIPYPIRRQIRQQIYFQIYENNIIQVSSHMKSNIKK